MVVAPDIIDKCTCLVACPKSIYSQMRDPKEGSHRCPCYATRGPLGDQQLSGAHGPLPGGLQATAWVRGPTLPPAKLSGLCQAASPFWPQCPRPPGENQSSSRLGGLRRGTNQLIRVQHCATPRTMPDTQSVRSTCELRLPFPCLASRQTGAESSNNEVTVKKDPEPHP